MPTVHSPKVVCEYDTNVKRRGLARSMQNPEDPQGIDVRERPLVSPNAVACQFCRSKSTPVFSRYPTTLWMISNHPLVSLSLPSSRPGRKTKCACDGHLPRCSNCEKRDQVCSYNYGAHSPEPEAGPASMSPSTPTAAAAAPTTASAGGVLPPLHSLQTCRTGNTS